MPKEKAVSPFIGDKMIFFSHMGLMRFFMYTGDVVDHVASDKTREKAHVDLVNFGPPNLDQMHMMRDCQSH